MLDQCPHCLQDLNLSEAQLGKINAALASLPIGRTLKIVCPNCRGAIELSTDGTLVKKEPDALAEVLYGEYAGPEDKAAQLIVNAAKKKPQPARLPPDAPAPPDLGWLQSGTYDEKKVVEKVPHAMILMGNDAQAAQVKQVVEAMGYQSLRPASAEEAIAKMQFMNFELVILHSGFEGGSLAESTVHQFLREMAMSRRRYMFYALLGPEFSTLYDLEALANSANQVINEDDLPHLPLLLRKGLHDSAALFGPYIEALGKYGVN